eukprot:scaffold32292_cov71-Phaeocystis_antarctica.AAC.7
MLGVCMRCRSSRVRRRCCVGAWRVDAPRVVACREVARDRVGPSQPLVGVVEGEECASTLGREPDTAVKTLIVAWPAGPLPRHE